MGFGLCVAFLESKYFGGRACRSTTLPNKNIVEDYG